MNTVILIGRLTDDIEIRQTAGGTGYADFTLAVDRSYRDKQTGERPTDFIRCRAWSKAAGILDSYTHKGNQIGVQGELRTYSYEDRDGNRRYGWNVNANQVHLLDSRQDRQQAPRPAQQQGAGVETMTEPADFSDEDLPF